LLLDNGANAELRDYFGDTAKVLAEKKGNAAVVELLADPPGTADGP
jgi:ankyrin repeat protein